MTEMYGSYSDEDLNEWERMPQNIRVLTSSAFGAWLLRRDKRIKERETKTGHCKNCKYFEYNSAAKVDGIPLIVAHEICNKWADGCKTKEDGFCFLFERKVESEG